jgi:hypothetical protein
MVEELGTLDELIFGNREEFLYANVKKFLVE